MTDDGHILQIAAGFRARRLPMRVLQIVELLGLAAAAAARP